MKKIFLLAIAAMLCSPVLFAKSPEDSLQKEAFKMLAFMDSVNTAMKYETGTVKLPNGIAVLNVPKSFKYLNAAQSKFVINKVWGNPERNDVLGMLFPADGQPFADSSYAFIISYDEMGYVKDEDADEINYDDLLKEIRESEAEANKERAANGYEPIHMMGWASQPFYDKNKKVLHWAKELRFGNSPDENTLNYDIRVLGRKGILSFNAVASMSGLPMVKKDIDQVLSMASFTAGNKYEDFDSNLDEVAAYTIGGLVAGKVLMKVGLWAVLLKFSKLIIGGLVAAFYAVRRFLTGRRKEDEYMVSEPETEEPVLEKEPEETTV